jgi:regulator of sigma E protease
LTSVPTILLALLGFNALVVVHELGHFVVARACGMRVTRFSIGLGPPLLRLTGKATTFQIALLPVGGFVQIAGMSGRVLDDGPGSYLRARRWQRALMVLAGPLANVIAAIAIYLYLFGSINALTTPPVGSNVVRAVEGPAAAAGLRPGDVVLAVQGKAVRFQHEVNAEVGAAQQSDAATTPVRLTVARPPEGDDAPRYDYQDIGDWEAGLWRAVPHVDPAWARSDVVVRPERLGRGSVRLGITFDRLTIGARDPAKVASLSAEKVWFYTESGVRMIAGWFSGREQVELSSVVRITQIGADTLRVGGASWFLNLLGMLSVSLFLLNLIPMPPLDGGRLLFLGIEMVTRRPVPARVQNAVQGLGIALLLGLMGLVTARDIVHLF